MIKTRDQSIFDEMFKLSESLGYQTFDFRQLKNTKYPFVDMESTETFHQPNKTDVKGNVVLIMNVWGLQTKRKQVSDMASSIFNEALKVERTDGYAWALNIVSSGFQMTDDTSTNTPLKRAMITLDFRLR